MTTAGGTGPGGSGMSYGDDYVAARLSIDIPEGSVEGVREITQAVDNFRISMEAATRVEADMTSYLEQMNEATKASNQALSDATSLLQSYMTLTGRQGSGTPITQSGVPGGPMQQPAPGQPGSGSQPSRPSSASDVPSQMARAAAIDPGSVVNGAQGRGMLTAQDVINISPQSLQMMADKIVEGFHTKREQDLHTQEELGEQSSLPGFQEGRTGVPLSQRVLQATSLAGRMMNELGPRGTTGGMANLMIQGLQYGARKSAQVASRRPTTAAAPTSTRPDGAVDEGDPGGGSPPVDEAGDASVSQSPLSALGGMGGLSKSLLSVAGGLTAALGVFEAVQKGGEMVQGWRNLASMRGGAAGEGAEVSAKARIMSMNPFITQDQARQIYQSVMSEGYADASGAGADNVIDFMKTNLTSMNISVADSAKMLRTTIVGKESGDKDSVNGALQMLRTELDSIREVSAKTAMSTPDYLKSVEALQGNMQALGASPEAAEGQAMLATQMGANDQAFKGRMATAIGDIANSPQAGTMLRAFGGADVPGGLMPQAVPGYLAQHGQLDQAATNVLRHFAQICARGDRGDEITHRNAITKFMMYVRQISPSSPAAGDYHEAEMLYQKLLGNQLVTDAQQDLAGQPQIGAGENEASVPQLPAAAFEPNAPVSVSPSGPGGPAAQASNGGGSGTPGGGGGGGAQLASVQVGLTPEASRLLMVLGGPAAQYSNTKSQTGSNQGRGGFARNTDDGSR